MNDCGIYKISSPTGFYIGSSCQLKIRLRKHRASLESGTHRNPRLQRAFNKYGRLEMEVLIICRKEDLLMYEQLCIDALQPTYNQSMIAGRVEPTDEVRAKKSAALKGRPGIKPSAATRAKMSASHRARPRDPEVSAKIAAALRGRTFSDEHRAKLSAWQRGRKIPAITIARRLATRYGGDR